MRARDSLAPARLTTRRIVSTTALAVLLALPAVAQESSKVACRPPRVRGATAPGGATIEVTVRNTGQPCRIAIMSDVEGELATTEIKAIEEPSHGKLEFLTPSVSAYTPNPGYVGPDAYAFVGRGPTRNRHTVDVRLNVKVTVVAP